jgi:hypothetical protein
MDETSYHNKFLVLALHQIIMNLIVTDEVIGSHGVE